MTHWMRKFLQQKSSSSSSFGQKKENRESDFSPKTVNGREREGMNNCVLCIWFSKKPNKHIPKITQSDKTSIT